MAWVKLDDTFPEHQKVLRAGPLASWLHVCAIAYCNRNLTDGYVPAAVAGRLADIPTPQRHIDALVREGMWVPVDGDYLLHDYLEYQPSKAKVLEEREKARKRMSSVRLNKPGGS